MSITLDVTSAYHVKPGDLWAGCYVPDAPTRPVQPFAAAHRISTVTRYEGEDGRPWVRMTAGQFELTPCPAATWLLIIRGV